MGPKETIPHEEAIIIDWLRILCFEESRKPVFPELKTKVLRELVR